MRKMLHYIYKITGKMVAPFFRKRVVIASDGGICSQMHFYLMGVLLRQRDLKVSFDLSWFDSCGKDMMGKYDRKFDLLRCFPYLEHRREGGLISKLMCRWYGYRNDIFENPGCEWMNIAPPAYLYGYYGDPEEMYTKAFRSTFHIDPDRVLDSENKRMLGRIRKSGFRSVAVHVRRGDLAQYLRPYGDPASKEYFIRARAYILENVPDAEFYFFSDEPEYVKENLISYFPGAEVVDLNGSDRGYMDLVLMSQCCHQIASKGSMGKYAAMLRPEEYVEGIVAMCEAKESAPWESRFKNSKLIAM